MIESPSSQWGRGRQRGRTHRRSRRCRMALVVGGSQPRPGKLLRGAWVLRDLPRKKGGGWLGLATVSRSWKQGRKQRHPYWWTAKPVARTKCTEKVPFIAAWAEGGWDGRDGSALAASARSCHVSSACMHGRRRRSERLLRWPHVEAMCAWCRPLAARGGEVDGASELRRATRHDGECKHTLSTRLRARAGSARRWPPWHVFGSGSLAIGAACSRTSSPSGRL
jgi:hypothetical protein